MARHSKALKAKVGVRRGLYVSTTIYFSEEERRWLEHQYEAAALAGKRVALGNIVRGMVQAAMHKDPIPSASSKETGEETSTSGSAA